MARRDLPDIYAHALGPAALGLGQAQPLHILQSITACGGVKV